MQHIEHIECIITIKADYSDADIVLRMKFCDILLLLTYLLWLCWHRRHVILKTRITWEWTGATLIWLHMARLDRKYHSTIDECMVYTGWPKKVSHYQIIKISY